MYIVGDLENNKKWKVVKIIHHPDGGKVTVVKFPF